MEPNNENSVGPVIAIIIVLAMIILGGLYFWGERTKDMNDVVPESQVDEVTASISSQSSSDEISSIEEDLENTNVLDLGSDLESL
ncbi:MAG: hypothetical protein ACYCY6_00815 [Minisyncoccota bacterium]